MGAVFAVDATCCFRASQGGSPGYSGHNFAHLLSSALFRQM